MGDSIAAAVRATSEATGWLILPGDLPLIKPSTLQSVAQALKAGAVVLPQYAGKRGHPVGFPHACLDALLHLSGAEGAASVVRMQAKIVQPITLDLDDEGIVTDIDTLDDLANAERVLARFAQR